MITIFTIHCPYCKTRNQVNVEFPPVTGYHCHVCTTARTGCGRTFVVEIDYRPFLRIFQLAPMPHGLDGPGEIAEPIEFVPKECVSDD